MRVQNWSSLCVKNQAKRLKPRSQILKNAGNGNSKAPHGNRQFTWQGWKKAVQQCLREQPKTPSWRRSQTRRSDQRWDLKDPRDLTSNCTDEKANLRNTCVQNIYIRLIAEAVVLQTLKITMGNNDNVNVTGSKHDYKMSTMPKPKGNMKTWVLERHLFLAWLIRRQITITYTITAFRNRKIWLM